MKKAKVAGPTSSSSTSGPISGGNSKKKAATAGGRTAGAHRNKVHHAGNKPKLARNASHVDQENSFSDMDIEDYLASLQEQENVRKATLARGKQLQQEEQHDARKARLDQLSRPEPKFKIGDRVQAVNCFGSDAARSYKAKKTVRYGVVTKLHELKLDKDEKKFLPIVYDIEEVVVICQSADVEKTSSKTGGSKKSIEGKENVVAFASSVEEVNTAGGCGSTTTTSKKGNINIEAVHDLDAVEKYLESQEPVHGPKPAVLQAKEIDVQFAKKNFAGFQSVQELLVGGASGNTMPNHLSASSASTSSSSSSGANQNHDGIFNSSGFGDRSSGAHQQEPLPQIVSIDDVTCVAGLQKLPKGTSLCVPSSSRTKSDGTSSPKWVRATTVPASEQPYRGWTMVTVPARQESDGTYCYSEQRYLPNHFSFPNEAWGKTKPFAFPLHAWVQFVKPADRKLKNPEWVVGRVEEHWYENKYQMLVKGITSTSVGMKVSSSKFLDHDHQTSETAPASAVFRGDLKLGNERMFIRPTNPAKHVDTSRFLATDFEKEAESTGGTPARPAQKTNASSSSSSLRTSNEAAAAADPTIMPEKADDDENLAVEIPIARLTFAHARPDQIPYTREITQPQKLTSYFLELAHDITYGGKQQKFGKNKTIAIPAGVQTAVKQYYDVLTKGSGTRFAADEVSSAPTPILKQNHDKNFNATTSKSLITIDCGTIREPRLLPIEDREPALPLFRFANNTDLQLQALRQSYSSDAALASAGFSENVVPFHVLPDFSFVSNVGLSFSVKLKVDEKVRQETLSMRGAQGIFSVMLHDSFSAKAAAKITRTIKLLPDPERPAYTTGTRIVMGVAEDLNRKPSQNLLKQLYFQQPQKSVTGLGLLGEPQQGGGTRSRAPLSIKKDSSFSDRTSNLYGESSDDEEDEDESPAYAYHGGKNTYTTSSRTYNNFSSSSSSSSNIAQSPSASTSAAGFQIPDNGHDEPAKPPKKWTQEKRHQLRTEQRKALSWMLERENNPTDVVISQRKITSPILSDDDWFRRLTWSKWAMEFEANYYYKVNGGILADKVGFGKTATMLSLIARQQDAERGRGAAASSTTSANKKEMMDHIPEHDKGAFFHAPNTTLVLVPSHLIDQWSQEVDKFVSAYNWNVLVVKDVRGLSYNTVREIAEYDLILCSYHCLYSDTYGRRVEDFLSGDKKHTPDSIKNPERGYKPKPAAANRPYSLLKLKAETKKFIADWDSGDDRKCQKYLQSRWFQNSEGLSAKRAKEFCENVTGTGGGEQQQAEGPEVTVLSGNKNQAKQKQQVVSRKRSSSHLDLLFPVLEQFYFRRVVFDEYHETEAKRGKTQVLMWLRGRSRWGMTGTPSVETIESVKTTAGLFNVDVLANGARGEWLSADGLQVPEHAPAHVLEGYRGAQRSLAAGAWKSQQAAKARNNPNRCFKEPCTSSVLWYNCQNFVSECIRQNATNSCVDEIETIHHDYAVQFTPAEQIFYLNTLSETASSGIDVSKKELSEGVLRQCRTLLERCSHFAAGEQGLSSGGAGSLNNTAEEELERKLEEAEDAVESAFENATLLVTQLELLRRVFVLCSGEVGGPGVLVGQGDYNESQINKPTKLAGQAGGVVDGATTTKTTPLIRSSASSSTSLRGGGTTTSHFPTSTGGTFALKLNKASSSPSRRSCKEDISTSWTITGRSFGVQTDANMDPGDEGLAVDKGGAPPLSTLVASDNVQRSTSSPSLAVSKSLKMKRQSKGNFVVKGDNYINESEMASESFGFQPVSRRKAATKKLSKLLGPAAPSSSSGSSVADAESAHTTTWHYCLVPRANVAIQTDQDSGKLLKNKKECFLESTTQSNAAQNYATNDQEEDDDVDAALSLAVVVAAPPSKRRKKDKSAEDNKKPTSTKTAETNLRLKSEKADGTKAKAKQGSCKPNSKNKNNRSKTSSEQEDNKDLKAAAALAPTCSSSSPKTMQSSPSAVTKIEHPPFLSEKVQDLVKKISLQYIGKPYGQELQTLFRTAAQSSTSTEKLLHAAGCPGASTTANITIFPKMTSSAESDNERRSEFFRKILVNGLESMRSIVRRAKAHERSSQLALAAAAKQRATASAVAGKNRKADGEQLKIDGNDKAKNTTAKATKPAKQNRKSATSKLQAKRTSTKDAKQNSTALVKKTAVKGKSNKISTTTSSCSSTSTSNKKAVLVVGVPTPAKAGVQGKKNKMKSVAVPLAAVLKVPERKMMKNDSSNSASSSAGGATSSSANSSNKPAPPPNPDCVKLSNVLATAHELQQTIVRDLERTLSTMYERAAPVDFCSAANALFTGAEEDLICGGCDASCADKPWGRAGFAVTKCAHLFCRPCLLESVNREQKCPECGERLDTLLPPNVYVGPKTTAGASTSSWNTKIKNGGTSQAVLQMSQNLGRVAKSSTGGNSTNDAKLLAVKKASVVGWALSEGKHTKIWEDDPGRYASLRNKVSKDSDMFLVPPPSAARFLVGETVSTTSLRGGPSYHHFGSKIQKICDVLVRIRDESPEDKVIVFVQFPSIQQKLASAFAYYDFNFMELCGPVHKQNRIMNSFKFDAVSEYGPSPDILLLNMSTAASGSDLVRASHVLLAHPFVGKTPEESAAYEEQAVGRVRRMGQPKTAVEVHRFYTAGTVEEPLHQRHVAGQAGKGKNGGNEAKQRGGRGASLEWM
ncbi:unnamed protein product [Amoebophrya sp. A120]|nr:unnamed protein product [Amoebophrya sp. A120]|eukprot:GSA120T00008485001.1